MSILSITSLKISILQNMTEYWNLPQEKTNPYRNQKKNLSGKKGININFKSSAITFSGGFFVYIRFRAISKIVAGET